MFKFLIVFLILSSFSMVIAQSNPSHSEIAKNTVNALFRGNLDEAYKNFGDTFKTQVPKEALPQLNAQIISAFGGFVKNIDTKEVSKEQLFLISEFEKSIVTFSVVFDSSDKIIGLNVADSKPQNAAKYETPSYANPASFVETEVTVGAGEWALPATLSMPKGKSNVPAIVLVHGSGPNDRDETHINPANKIFKDIAWGLASKGIAVLRYDKRTLVHGRKFPKNFTLNEETVYDAVLAVELLRKTPNISIKEIYVLGHSLGGMAIPRIGAKDKNIAGLIVFAGTARPLEDVLLEQYYYLTSLDGNVTPQEKELVEKIKTEVAAIKNLQANNLTGKILAIAPDYFWFDLKNYNPPDAAKKLKQPMLILQGERDYQVTMEDFKLWKNALVNRKNVVFKSYPNLTHSFMDGLAGKPSPKDYDAVSHVKEVVITDISEWILKRKK